MTNHPHIDKVIHPNEAKFALVYPTLKAVYNSLTEDERVLFLEYFFLTLGELPNMVKPQIMRGIEECLEEVLD